MCSTAIQNPKIAKSLASRMGAPKGLINRIGKKPRSAIQITTKDTKKKQQKTPNKALTAPAAVPKNVGTSGLNIPYNV